MAAFIRKLFKNRNAQPTPPPQPQPCHAETRDKQQDLKSEQDLILKGQPTLQQLEQLAIDGITADIRQQAATAIDDRDALNRVQKASKGKDKGVYQLVRNKLQAIKQAEAALSEAQDRLQALIQQAEEQARSEDTKLYEARFEALLQQWKLIEAQASTDQVSAFLNACHGCRERIQALADDAAEQERHADQAQQRASTIELIEATLEDLRGSATETLPSLSALDALQKTQENRWLEATRDTQVPKSEQKQYEVAMQSLKSLLAALRRFSSEGDAIQNLLAHASDNTLPQPQRAEARALTDHIAWPSGFTMPASLDQLNALVKAPVAPVNTAADDDKQRPNTKAFVDTLNQLEQTLEGRQLKESRQLFKKAQQLHKTLNKANSKPHQARLQLLGGQLRELNDWQGYATGPKQLALCEQMEYLAEQPMEPEAKAERIKELQNEWRGLGGSSDRTLWDRFKKASDAAYEPCKAYFAAKSGLKQTNLEKRERICDELDTFLSSTDLSNADWKAVDQILRTARAEWKAAWPVEFRDNRSVQKRFDALLKRLESSLNAEREKNEQLKQEIVERAEALISHEPLADAMNQAKALQGEWQAIGITRHREDRKLWRSFRKACDAVFERRDAERSVQRQQTEAADQRLRDTLAQTQTVSGQEATPESLREAQQALDALASAPHSRELADQLRAERSRLNDLKAQQAQAERIASWHQRIDTCQDDPATNSIPEAWARRSQSMAELGARELVIRAEILSEVPSPEQDQALRMQIQVQRLSDGLGGGNTEGNAADQLESLVAHWCVGLANGEREPAMAERLKVALSASVS